MKRKVGDIVKIYNKVKKKTVGAKIISIEQTNSSTLYDLEEVGDEFFSKWYNRKESDFEDN